MGEDFMIIHDLGQKGKRGSYSTVSVAFRDEIARKKNREEKGKENGSKRPQSSAHANSAPNRVQIDENNFARFVSLTAVWRWIVMRGLDALPI